MRMERPVTIGRSHRAATTTRSPRLRRYRTPGCVHLLAQQSSAAAGGLSVDPACRTSRPPRVIPAAAATGTGSRGCDEAIDRDPGGLASGRPLGQGRSRGLGRKRVPRSSPTPRRRVTVVVDPHEWPLVGVPEHSATMSCLHQRHGASEGSVPANPNLGIPITSSQVHPARPVPRSSAITPLRGQPVERASRRPPATT